MSCLKLRPDDKLKFGMKVTFSSSPVNYWLALAISKYVWVLARDKRCSQIAGFMARQVTHWVGYETYEDKLTILGDAFADPDAYTRCDECGAFKRYGEIDSELYTHDDTGLDLCEKCTNSYDARFDIGDIVKVRNRDLWGEIVEVGEDLWTLRPQYAITTGDGERFAPEELEPYKPDYQAIVEQLVELAKPFQCLGY